MVVKVSLIFKKNANPHSNSTKKLIKYKNHTHNQVHQHRIKSKLLDYSYQFSKKIYISTGFSHQRRCRTLIKQLESIQHTNMNRRDGQNSNFKSKQHNNKADSKSKQGQQMQKGKRFTLMLVVFFAVDIIRGVGVQESASGSRRRVEWKGSKMRNRRRGRR